jgi:hypothetical protein
VHSRLANPEIVRLQYIDGRSGLSTHKKDILNRFRYLICEYDDKRNSVESIYYRMTEANAILRSRTSTVNKGPDTAARSFINELFRACVLEI